MGGSLHPFLPPARGGHLGRLTAIAPAHAT